MSNLDDFFKKRDKKKKSTKTKFPTLDTDELAKNLEATAIKGEEDVDFQDNNNNLTSTNLAVNDNLDEEWKPYEDENKDLSGLKITFLKQVEDENNDFSGVIDENEKKSACPWGAVCATAQNKQTEESKEDATESSNVKQTALSDSTNQQANTDIQKSSSTTQIAAAATSDSTTASTTTNTSTTSSSSAYVPPALRRQQQQQPDRPATTTDSLGLRKTEASSAISATTTSGRRRNQPNINDTMEFPTLDAAGSDIVNQTEKTSTVPGERFEIAKKGARIEPKAEGHMINLANKFTALSSNN